MSTSIDVDLSRHNDVLLQFSREIPAIPEAKYLAFEFRWFVGSRYGCSCGFRHLSKASVSFAFSELQEDFPEDYSDLSATAKVIGIVRELVASGGRVDCVDAWNHKCDSADPLSADLEVFLSKVADTSFRFFEMQRFFFSAGPDSESGEPVRKLTCEA